MTTTLKPNLPCIFLAFANDPADENRYLRNLLDEAQRIKEILSFAQENQLCELVIRNSASINDIFQVFQDANYRDRIVVFHFAGHANSFQLLLESSSGEVEAAHVEGMASLLGCQASLQLVFLNACATFHHVQGLLDEQVPCVIATNQMIDDKLATQFAGRFYSGFANGANIRSAFTEAKAEATARKGSQSRFGPPSTNDQPLEDTAPDSLPWQLYVKPGAEQTLYWSLPEAAGDPLFGLPTLPEQDLPEMPYRYLNVFEENHAELFFGRGLQIRQLYDRLTDKSEAPLLLLYGGSGVGKSSLITGGLLPRLARNFELRYTRRVYEYGLLHSLTASLSDTNGYTELQNWKDLENASHKPLIVFLDQIEETFTRSNPALPNELEQFIQRIGELFSNPNLRPQGKLVLSFRKEWLPEIVKACGRFKVPMNTYFLEPLNKQGIIEVVEGPCKNPRLVNLYQLHIESGLSAYIADTLLKDSDSPVAPVLQVLLSKLWHAAYIHDKENMQFDRAQYRQLENSGLLLGDFLDQQIAHIGELEPTSVQSGLILDFLAYFTTTHSTATEHDLNELEQYYSHCSDVILNLVNHCKERSLLMERAYSSDSLKLRLMHDTLAPLVRARFEESDYPGQRARRILENRAVEWRDGRTGIPLDQQDLSIVEQGFQGMRAWNEEEQKLVELSRELELRKSKLRKRWKSIGVLAIIMICLTSVTSIYMWNQANSAKDRAVQQRNQILARQLATEAGKLINNVPYEQTLASLLTVESLRSAYTQNGFHTWKNLTSLLPITETIIPANPAIAAYKISPNRSYLFALENVNSRSTVYLVNLSTNQVAAVYPMKSQVSDIAFDPDKIHAAVAEQNGQINFIDMTNGQILKTSNVKTTITSVKLLHDNNIFFSALEPGNNHIQRPFIMDKEGIIKESKMPDYGGVYQAATNSKLIVTLGYDHLFKLWDIHSLKLKKTIKFDDKTILNRFSLNNNFLAYLESDTSVNIIDVNHTERRHSIKTQDNIKRFLLNPEKKQIAIVLENKTIELWNIETSTKTASLSPADVFCATNSNADHESCEMAFNFEISRNGNYLVGAGQNNGNVLTWSTKNGRLLWKKEISKSVRSVYFNFSDQHNIIAMLASPYKNIHLYKIDSGDEIASIDLDSILTKNTPLYSNIGQADLYLLLPYPSAIALYNFDKKKIDKIIKTTGESLSQDFQPLWSQNRRWVVLMNEKNTILIFDIKTGKKHSQFALNDFISSSQFLTPNKLLINDISGDAFIYDINLKLIIRRFRHTSAYRKLLDNLSDNNLIAISGNKVNIFNPSSEKWKSSLHINNAEFSDVAFDDNSNFLATAYILDSNNKTINIWNTKDGKLVTNIKLNKKYISEIKFLPNEKSILVAHNSTTYDIDIKSKAVKQQLDHLSPVKHLNISPKGSCIAAQTFKGIEIWQREPEPKLISFIADAESPSLINECKDLFAIKNHHLNRIRTKNTLPAINSITHPDWPYQTSLNHEERILATNIYSDQPIYGITNNDNNLIIRKSLQSILDTKNTTPQILLWDLESENFVGKIRYTSPILDLDFMPKSNRIFFTDNENHLLVTGNGEFTIKKSLTLPEAGLKFLFTPDSTKLAVLTVSHKIGIFDIDTSDFKYLDQDNILEMVQSRDKRYFAALSGSLEGCLIGNYLYQNCLEGDSYLAKNKIVIWELPSGKKLNSIHFTQHSLPGFDFSNDASKYILVSAGRATLHSLSSANIVEIPVPDLLNIAKFSPDNQHVILQNQDEIVFWNVLTQKELGRISLHTESGNFRTNLTGELIAIVTGNQAHIWNINSLQELAILDHEKPITDVKFTSDDRIITTSMDFKSKVWTLNNGKLVDILCNSVERNFTLVEWRRYFGNIPYRNTCH